MLIAFVVALVFFLCAGTPVAFVMLLTSFAMLLTDSTIPLMVLPQRMIIGADSFIMLAIPLFLLAGRIMNTGGITKKLFKFAIKLVGHIPGGLGHVNIVASLIFAGMSGSAAADAAGLGLIEIEAMKDEGFDGPFSAAVTAASSVIGPIFPPSIPFVVYGGLAGVSIARLFLGGAIPAILMVLYMMVVVVVIAKKRKYPQYKRATFRELMQATKEAFLPLLTPVIILGSILFGITTPTEAAVLAVAYAIILAFFVYKDITLKEMWEQFVEAAIESGGIMFIISTVSGFTWLATRQNIPQALSEMLLSLASSPTELLLITVVIFLIIGCFITVTTGLILCVPLLAPVAQLLAMDPVHYGVLCVLVMCVGLVTPPVGLSLFISARIAGCSTGAVIKETIPFVVVLILVSLTIAFVPGTATWLPNLLMGQQ
jgi:tripartite ATP-independent transporter DctM subunit